MGGSFKGSGWRLACCTVTSYKTTFGGSTHSCWRSRGAGGSGRSLPPAGAPLLLLLPLHLFCLLLLKHPVVLEACKLSRKKCGCRLCRWQTPAGSQQQGDRGVQRHAGGGACRRCAWWKQGVGRNWSCCVPPGHMPGSVCLGRLHHHQRVVVVLQGRGGGCLAKFGERWRWQHLPPYAALAVSSRGAAFTVCQDLGGKQQYS